jgi:hypothetical protein
MIVLRISAPPFRAHARAEKKCAASPGGTFFILLQGVALSTRAPDNILFAHDLFRKPMPTFRDHALFFDSKLPQAPILKENLLVAGIWGLQKLARESPDIVAFFSASTTSRARERFLGHS